MSGGVTSFLDMPNNKPSITDMDGMRMKLQTASNQRGGSSSSHGVNKSFNGSNGSLSFK